MDFNRFFKSRQGEMLHTLKSLVALESPTADKAAVDACAAFVTKEFAKPGPNTPGSPRATSATFIFSSMLPAP